MQLTALANGEEKTASASVGIWPLAAPCPAAVLPNNPLTTDEYGIVDPPNHIVPHTGRDVHATKGTAFKSARDGIVVQRDSTKSGGLRLIVRATDGSNRLSYYYHLKDTSVHESDTVTAGQVLGHTGDSGNVSAHLHFEEHIDNAGDNFYDPVTLKTRRTNLLQPCTF
jgi:murein DD-endopeptidase MepM/ murein hydrolase activator NlpD